MLFRSYRKDPEKEQLAMQQSFKHHRVGFDGKQSITEICMIYDIYTKCLDTNAFISNIITNVKEANVLEQITHTAL